MASHQFAIAKASFSAGLLRPDPTSLSREAIAHFHSLLNTAVQQCSPRNVQKCKQWIVQNVVQSTARFAALGKYLTALASSFTEAAKSQDTSPTNREPSIKRRRIHILYILNDILYHAKYHIHDASISSKVQPILVDLITTTASFKDCPKHQRKVLDLLDLWEDKGYYSAEYIDKLRETARNASEFGGLFSAETALSEAGTRDTTVKVTKAAPYVMPAFHGDSSTPWFDLPAGNLMPHIVPNSTRPINPELIKPLQLVAGPADESLAFAVKALLDDVDKIFGLEAEDGLLADIDELGQPIILDELTGDVVGGEGYYGWSRSFCERMKRRRKGIQGPNDEDDRGRRSRSSSREPRKRRYSDSDRSSVSDHGRRRRRRSYSSSRSPSTDHDRRAIGTRRSRSPFNPSHEASNNLPPKPLTSSYPVPPSMYPHGINPNFPPPPPPPQPPFTNQGPPYGNWVPPPPPPPLHNMQFNNGQQQFGSWPPPPPPIPPPNMPPGGWQHHQAQGRGYNNNNNNGGWQGRGGRGGYRGRGW